MNIKKLKHFAAHVASEAGDIFPGISDLRVIYRHGDKWFDEKSRGLVSEVDSLRADKATSISGRVLSVPREATCYVWVPAVDAVVLVQLAKSPRSKSQGKLLAGLDKALLTAMTQFRSTHDKLTELLNQDSFEQALSSALDNSSGSAAASPSGQDSAARADAVALLSFDIDHFKSVNDRFGHQHGDAVLAVFSWRLELVCEEFISKHRGRLTVKAFRPGGEEFYVLVSGKVSSDDVIALAENVLQTARKNALPDDTELHVIEKEGRVALSEPPDLSERRITISCGVSIGPKVDKASVRSQSSRLKKQADTALYSAKLGGRDRVRFFDEILKSHGRVVEVHATTGVIAIDIGQEVGVQKGQEFFVVPPDFDGVTPFFAGEGRSRKRLGNYPRVKSGRIVVFEVQREVSFCREVHRSEGALSFPVGSTLEAIPLGSVSHLIATGAGVSESSLGTAADLKEVVSAKQGAVHSVVSCLVRRFDLICSDRGTGFANQVLAFLVQEFYNRFGGKLKVGHSEIGNLIAVVPVQVSDDSIMADLSGIRELLQARFGDGVDVAFGYWMLSLSVDDSPEWGLLNSAANALDFAASASAVADATRVCRILCKRDFGLQLRQTALELDGKAVQSGLPVADRHRPFLADVA